MLNSASGRGDLFSELSSTVSGPEDKPYYMSDQFVWTFKWTLLFGMLIAIVMNDSGHAAFHVIKQVTVKKPIAEFIAVKLDHRCRHDDLL